MGLALYGVIWLQALTGFFRPQRYERPISKSVSQVSDTEEDK